MLKYAVFILTFFALVIVWILAAGHTIGSVEMFVCALIAYAVFGVLKAREKGDKTEDGQKATTGKQIRPVSEHDTKNFIVALQKSSDGAIRYLAVGANTNDAATIDFFVGVDSDNYPAFDRKEFTALLNSQFYGGQQFQFVDLRSTSPLTKELHTFGTSVKK